MTFFITVSVFSLLKLAVCSSIITKSSFTKGAICDVTQRIRNGCSRELTKKSTIIKCVGICSVETSCKGASLDENDHCFLHYECPSLPSCLVTNTNHRYMSKYCVYGKWNPVTQSCDCVDYVSGERCNQFLRDCADLITPDHVFGEYKVLIDPNQDGLNPISVLCRTQSQDRWGIVVSRNEGKVNSDRSWQEFKSGFFEDDKNLWAGLDVWHQMSAAGCNHLTTTLAFDWTPVSKVVRYYENFVMGDETEDYQFSFSGSDGSMRGTPPPGSYFGDCLGPLQNTPLSTWDRDQDGNATENCAAKAGSGWWYSGCDNPCNLLGYGYDHWFSKPRPELFSVEGVDMDAHASVISHITMFLTC